MTPAEAIRHTATTARVGFGLTELAASIIVRCYLDALDPDRLGAAMEHTSEVSWHEVRDVIQAIRP